MSCISLIVCTYDGVTAPVSAQQPRRRTHPAVSSIRRRGYYRIRASTRVLWLRSYTCGAPGDRNGPRRREQRGFAKPIVIVGGSRKSKARDNQREHRWGASLERFGRRATPYRVASASSKPLDESVADRERLLTGAVGSASVRPAASSQSSNSFEQLLPSIRRLSSSCRTGSARVDAHRRRGSPASHSGPQRRLRIDESDESGGRILRLKEVAASNPMRFSA